MTNIRIAVPTSTILNEPGLLLKTIKTYQVIRAASIFGVKQVILYNDGYTDPVQHRKAYGLAAKIHEYLTTPPYLRRKLIPLDPDLKHVGILPPLRLKAYDVSVKPRRGEVRLGLIIHGGKVDVGLSEPYTIVDGGCGVRDGIIPVKIIDTQRKIAQCLKKNVYRGPSLTEAPNIISIINRYDNTTIIATSRHGRKPSLSELKSLTGSLTILFGSPKHGLREIMEKHGVKIDEKVKYIWNTIPRQKVKTIRTEEAVIITLGIINMFLRKR